MSSQTAAPVDHLAATLRKLDLLLPEQVPMLEAALATCADSHSLARRLIQQGCLTPFQANQLLQSNGRSIVLGPYALLDRVGAGGMGEVFKARHRRLHRIAAVKVIGRDKLGNDVARGRFVREWEAAAQLSHPNIVAVLDAGEEDGTLYLAMELVDGIDLGRLLQQEGPLPVALALEVARQAALGLGHAHSLGYVHRDMKPQNLLAAPRGGMARGLSGFGRFTGAEIKVLDLGLVRLQPHRIENTQLALTQHGIVLGTMDYCAPEQARNSHRVDCRADFYALGCTIYHLLAGTAPFSGGSALDKLLRHQSDIAPPLRQRRPDVPATLERVIARMMAKNPADRHATANELVEELAAVSVADSRTVPVLAGPTPMDLSVSALEPTRVLPAQIPALPSNPRRRWPWAVAVAGLVLLLCLLVGRSGKRPTPESEAKPPESKHETKPQPKPRPKPKNPADFDRFFPPGTAAVVGVQPRLMFNAPILNGDGPTLPLGITEVLKLAGADPLKDVDHLRIYYPTADPLEATWLAHGNFNATTLAERPGLRHVEREGESFWQSESPAVSIGNDGQHLFGSAQPEGVMPFLAHAVNPVFTVPSPELWEAFSGAPRDRTIWMALAPRKLGQPASWGKDKLLGAILNSVFANARVVSGGANVGRTLHVSFTFDCHDETTAMRLATSLTGYKWAMALASLGGDQNNLQKLWTTMGANAVIVRRNTTVTLTSNVSRVPAP